MYKKMQGFTIFEVIVFVAFGIAVIALMATLITTYIDGDWRAKPVEVKSGVAMGFVWEMTIQKGKKGPVNPLTGRTINFHLEGDQNTQVTILSVNGNPINATDASSVTDLNGLINVVIEVDGDGKCWLRGTDAKSNRYETAYFKALP